MVMDGPFYFNGNSFDMMRIDYEIPLNNIEIWKLVNETMVAHPFHIHDVQFFLIDRSGNVPSAEELGRKDVVLVPPFDSVMFITKFEDFADTTVPFMYHCHILMHEDDGMMGQFIVKPLSVGVNELKNNNNSLTLYPNPTSNLVNIDAKEMTSISVFNTLGEIVYAQNKISTNSLQINTSQWSKGIYTVQVNSNNQSITKKLIVN
jgi:blue copper oxidase